jgi:hypothetical protein
MLRCKINSAKLCAPGGPVSSKSGDIALCEFAMKANFPKQRSALETPASFRAQPFVIVGTTARRILQHWIPAGGDGVLAGWE